MEKKETTLQRVRKAQGFTQRSLSEATGISLRTIQHWEQGSKDFNQAAALTVYTVARALGVDMLDLLDIPDAEEAEEEDGYKSFETRLKEFKAFVDTMPEHLKPEGVEAVKKLEALQKSRREELDKFSAEFWDQRRRDNFEYMKAMMAAHAEYKTKLKNHKN